MQDDRRGSPDERLGANLRALREDRGMSQSALAAAMTERGYRWHQQTVTRVEAGEQPVRFGELEQLAEILRTSVDRFRWTQPEASATEYIYSAGTRVVRSADDVAKAVHRLLADIAAAERTLAMTAETPYPRAQEARRDTAIRVETYTLDAAIDEGIRSYEERPDVKEGDDAAQGES